MALFEKERLSGGLSQNSQSCQEKDTLMKTHEKGREVKHEQSKCATFYSQTQTEVNEVC